jgi:hypothetical protein
LQQPKEKSDGARFAECRDAFDRAVAGGGLRDAKSGDRNIEPVGDDTVAKIVSATAQQSMQSAR